MKFLNKVDLLTILQYSGALMIAVGIMCLIPLIVSLIYFEEEYIAFLIPGVISIALGLICNESLKKHSKTKIRLKHGMIISSFGWMWASIIGAFVFYIATDLGFLEGVFESMSSLTGSGISMYTDVESLPYSVLFFRSLEQWIGGVGVVVMVIGILTRPGTTSAKLYKSEAHEERIKPSIKNTLKQTFQIYVIYTVVGIILYLIAGMPLFDAICNTFTSISTGGMSIKNENFGYYNNDFIYIITMILMILGATSFLVHYKIIKTKGKSLLKDLQFKVMIGIIIGVSIIVILASEVAPMNLIFAVVSAITTTGASIDTAAVMGTWPPFVIICLMALMLIGGSNGSTVGAIKLLRVITFVKGVYRHIKEILSPEGRVIPVKISGNRISDKSIAESGTFITLYLMFILISWAIFCLFGHDPFKSLFGIISLQGNVGLNMGVMTVDLDPILKVVGIFNMWIGRLEIYPVLILIRGAFEIFKK